MKSALRVELKAALRALYVEGALSGMEQASDVAAEAGFRDVAQDIKAFDWRSPSTVHEHLTHLERKGHISRDHNQPRAITVLTGTP